MSSSLLNSAGVTPGSQWKICTSNALTMDAVMVARRTSFIVVTPLCFFITARYRGTAHVPRLLLLPDVSGSTKGTAFSCPDGDECCGPILSRPRRPHAAEDPGATW